MRPATFATLALCAFVLSACETPNDFGAAVQSNIATQTVNPNAPMSKPPQRMNGERAALGQKRYTTDTVKQPENMETSDVSGSGGNGGNGSGSGSSPSTSGGTSP